MVCLYIPRGFSVPGERWALVCEHHPGLVAPNEMAIELSYLQDCGTEASTSVRALPGASSLRSSAWRFGEWSWAWREAKLRREKLDAERDSRAEWHAHASKAFSRLAFEILGPQMQHLPEVAVKRPAHLHHLASSINAD